jgi:hypothetical protein
MTEPNEYTERLAVCLRDGHTPQEWNLGLTTRVLCTACGRTWGSHWLRLMSMPGIPPIEQVA